jgi:hypothetical protein
MATMSAPHDDLQELLDRLARMASLHDDLPDPNTPLGMLTREFLINTYENCLAGLLSKTKRIRVIPEPAPIPRIFHFEMDLPYKRKLGPDAPVELMPGPIRGAIIYRPDMFANLHEPSVAVRLDPSMGYFHSNYSRRHNLVCLGDTTEFRGPIDLELLLENHLYPILSYQNRRPHHTADVEASQYFAFHEDAMHGLEPVPPLY